MTVIPVFWIRILICDQILPRLLLARLTERQWENWILKAHRAPNPETWISAAAKRNKEQSMIKSDLNRRELLKITAGAYAQRRCRA